MKMKHDVKHRIIVDMERERRMGLEIQIRKILESLRNDEMEMLLAKMKEWQNL